MHRRLRPFPPVALATLVAALPAQEALPDIRKLVPIDHVVATVNDAVILYSEILQPTAGAIRVREAELGRKLTEPEMVAILRPTRMSLINEHALAQAAKTLGIFTPDQIEQIFQERLRAKEDEEVREMGSLQNWSKELARTDRTYPSFYRAERLRTLSELTRQMGVYMRLQNQQSLFITVQMMRQFYRHNRSLFVHGALAEVGTITFHGQGDGSAALQTAREAAELWRKDEIEPAALQKRMQDRGARLPQILTVSADVASPLPKDLLDFALAGPAGNVSEPVAIGSSWQVRKVLVHRPARNDGFDNAEVQDEIRRQLEMSVSRALFEQTTQRALDRTDVWQAPQLR